MTRYPILLCSDRFPSDNVRNLRTNLIFLRNLHMYKMKPSRRVPADSTRQSVTTIDHDAEHFVTAIHSGRLFSAASALRGSCEGPPERPHRRGATGGVRRPNELRLVHGGSHSSVQRELGGSSFPVPRTYMKLVCIVKTFPLKHGQSRGTSTILPCCIHFRLRALRRSNVQSRVVV